MRGRMGEYAFEIEKSKKGGRQEIMIEVSTDAAFFRMNRYEAFLKKMSINSDMKKERALICEKDTDYVQTYKVKRNTQGKIFELRCPASTALSIFGKNQTVLLFNNEPNEFEIKGPYFFGVKCFDKLYREPHPDTLMNFQTVSKKGFSRAWRVSYRDISPVNPVKYSIPEGLYLSGDDMLELAVLYPDIDIDRIELLFEADIFMIKAQD